MHKDVARLAAFLACVALATSRFGLVLHELAGHGGAALALGGDVIGVKLFWFAGGWIRYRGITSAGDALVVAMAGIALELACGVALWCLPQGDKPVLRAVGAGFVAHGSWYLATGAWHGYGDGALLHEMLGDARWPVAIAAGALACTAAFFGARAVFGALGPPRRAIVALVIAGGLNAALAGGELYLRRDRTYISVMATARDRDIAADVARYREQHPDANAADRAAAEAEAERAHRTFPFAWLLGACVASAAILGARRSPRRELHPRYRLAALAAATSLALVIALGAML